MGDEGKRKRLGHKRECHKCQYNGKGSDVCLDCPGPSENSFKGINYIWLDILPDPDGMVDKRINQERSSDPTDPFPKPVSSPYVSNLDEDVEEAVIKIVADFMSLPPRTLQAVQRVWTGQCPDEAAEAMGVTADEYKAMIRTACKASPPFMITVVKQGLRHIMTGFKPKRWSECEARPKSK